MAAHLDATVITVGGLEYLQFFWRSVVETAFDIIVQGRLVLFGGKRVVGTAVEDGGRSWSGTRVWPKVPSGWA
jgi:hypothetical protein